MNRRPIRALYYEWIGTRNNHVGMAYFAKCLKRDLGFPFSIFRNSPKDYRHINLAKQYARLTLPWTESLFFMEYLSPIGIANQEEIALSLRKWGVKKPMIGLVHLPEELLLKYWKMEYICAALDAVDHVIVYGSSLSKFFERIGYGHKVKQTFHYVDADYYHLINKKQDNEGQFKVLVFGMLLRNMHLVLDIVQQCPDITFEICAGTGNLKSIFDGQPNVLLYDYMPEEALRFKLQHADVSLSVLQDTVGSNSIMTGLACGLPQIVSDVGSIRDYCSEENSIFCKERDDYLKAIRLLSQNKDLCLKMGKSARKRAEELSLPNSIRWFKEFFATVS